MKSLFCFFGDLQASDNDMDPVFTVSTRKGMRNVVNFFSCSQNDELMCQSVGPRMAIFRS